jgi:hypothetical protein
VTVRRGAAPFLLFVWLAGCSTMTPQEAAGLKQAQRMAGEVTVAYGVKRTRVVPDPQRSVFVPRPGYVRVEKQLLADNAFHVVLALAIAPVTLGPWTWEHPPSEDQKMSRQKTLAVNRRAVEIMVGFVGLTEAEAVNPIDPVTRPTGHGLRGVRGECAPHWPVLRPCSRIRPPL